MYYALAHFPGIETDGIDCLRRKHDPTVDLIDPHIPVMFPIPATIEEDRLLEHAGKISGSYEPFHVRTGGFSKSWDHWLFLTLLEGYANVENLHERLYSGDFARYRRRDIKFIPHIGLGLFVTPDVEYDLKNPSQLQLDAVRYTSALNEAKELGLEYDFLFDRLHLVRISDDYRQIQKYREFLLGESLYA